MTSCTLHAETVDIVFHWRSARPKQDYFDAVIEMKLHAGLPALKWQSVPTYVHVGDVRQMITYLVEHVNCLRRNSSAESPVYMPRELGFQVQALAGDIDPSGDDGEFAVRFQVNVGQPEGCSRTFVGAETIITVLQLREFLAEIDALLSEQLATASVGENSNGKP